MIYEPREDSYLLQKEVKKYVKDKFFLDMGSGSGIQSETAINSGAKSVLATDIQDDVITFLKKKKIPIRKSDLFSNIKKSETFDLIAFNPPYLPQDSLEDEESTKVTSGGKKGDEIILRFLEEAPEHLNKNGIILILISSLTPKDKIDKFLKKKNLFKETLCSEKLFMEVLKVWKLSRR